MTADCLAAFAEWIRGEFGRDWLGPKTQPIVLALCDVAKAAQLNVYMTGDLRDALATLSAALAEPTPDQKER